MTTSVLELIPTGGTAGWDRMGLGYDASPPLAYTVFTNPNVPNFSLQDAAVAGVIDKITVCYRISCTEAYGGKSYIYITVNSAPIADAYREENDPTWYYKDVVLNPATGVAWLWPEIDDLLAGLQFDCPYNGWVNLLQFKVQVTYTPEAYVPPMLVRGSVGIGAGSMMF